MEVCQGCSSVEEGGLSKNYRPVALLSVISKIMERVVFNQMIEFLEHGQILHPSHHGFRSKHSTSTALLQMQDTWLDALDRGEMSAVVLCDMSAAFDLVNHGILLKKLELYGFQDKDLFLGRSYMFVIQTTCQSVSMIMRFTQLNFQVRILMKDLIFIVTNVGMSAAMLMTQLSQSQVIMPLNLCKRLIKSIKILWSTWYQID